MACMASPETIVTAIYTDGSITVKRVPFGTEKRFKSISGGKIQRHEPALDRYERVTRFDTTPDHVKRNIEDFYRRHAVPMSPNKNDEVKRWHPLYPAQVETKQAMLRYESINEMWQKFIIDHEE